MKENNAFLIAFPVTIVVTAVVAVILVIFVEDKAIPLSLALGSVTSLMMMSSLQRSTNKVLLMEDKVKAQRQTIKNYAFRYFFYALILGISAYHDNLNVLYVAIGLFIFKIVLYAILLIYREDGKSND